MAQKKIAPAGPSQTFNHKGHEGTQRKSTGSDQCHQRSSVVSFCFFQSAASAQIRGKPFWFSDHRITRSTDSQSVLSVSISAALLFFRFPLVFFSPIFLASFASSAVKKKSLNHEGHEGPHKEINRFSNQCYQCQSVV